MKTTRKTHNFKYTFAHVCLVNSVASPYITFSLVKPSLTLRSGHSGRTTLKGFLDRPRLLQAGLMHGFRQLCTGSASPSPNGRTDHLCVPTAQRTPTRAGGYRWRLGAAAPLPRPEYLSHRYCAPAKHRANVVCRFSHEE